MGHILINLKKLGTLISSIATCVILLTATGANAWNVPRPGPGATWQWQLNGTPVNCMGKQICDFDFQAYGVDAKGTAKRRQLIKQLHATHPATYLICYVDVGSVENSRPDATWNDYDPAALSNINPDWPDERWLNIHLVDQIGPTGKTPWQIIQNRIQSCANDGFDAVEPDMIEAAFNLDTAVFTPADIILPADQAAFNIRIANEIRANNMDPWLKGDRPQATELEPYFVGAIEEEMYEVGDQDSMAAFTKAKKPILAAEYTVNFKRKLPSGLTVCQDAKKRGFSLIKKKLMLTAPILDSCQ